MANSLKKDKSKIRTAIDMLLIEEKGIRGELYHAIHRYVNANNKYIKIMIKTKKCCTLSIGM